MSLLLTSIAFNRTPLTGGEALNLRRNGSEVLPVPEWRRGISARPEDSVAAYAIESTRGRRLRVAAEFINLNPRVMKAEVRALAIHDGNVPPVLGDLAARFVWFGTGPLSGRQEFASTQPVPDSLAVGAHILRWRWELRRSQFDAWQTFALTQHRIYTTLRQPTLPWMQFPYSPANTQLPWVDVLEHACNWARGARTVVEAAKSVTRSMYDLGGKLVFYDCPGLGATHYTRYTPAVVFECSEFLELLSGGLGNGNLVNCVDCAAITSTFANILGCDLWQSGMFDPAGGIFALNPIRAIGSNVWQTACGWPGFGYHEVAWEGECTAAQGVYDACLEVNGGSNPARPPHIPLLPANMRFGSPPAGHYRDRLCTPAGRPNCDPQPAATRRRRPVV